MKRTVSLFEFMPYGAPELLAADRPHLARALMLSSLAAVLVFLAAWPMLSRLSTRTIVVRTYDLPYDFMPRPIIEPPPPDLVPPRVLPQPASALPAGAISELVSDAPEVSFESEPALTTSGEIETGTSGDPIVIPGGRSPVAEVLPERGAARPVDELPAEIVVYKPDYPSIARDAGVEGLVVVHALIGRDGRVLRAEVDAKHSIPLLDETAREAALRWRFTPAYYGGQSVAVWYAIPFRFVLNGP